MSAASLPAAIAATNLKIGHPNRLPVLNDAAISVSAGSRVALLGANGAGKTTLLRCLSGALRPAEGSVHLDDAELRYGRADLRAHRAQVQLVLQDPDDQLFSADVRQDVSFGPLNLGLTETEAEARVAEVLGLLGISELASRPSHQLSQGERKRVALAGALAMRPRVLLLDEPTAGLDPAGVSELLAALEQVSATVIFATHDVDLALAWADSLAIIANSKIRQGDLRLLADRDLVGAARLRRPWQLELAERLGHDPQNLPLNQLPRTIDQVAAMFAESRR